jgi:hypothetical protein
MQTSMDKNPAVALAGVPANFDRLESESFLNEDTNDILPGYPLIRGTDPETQVKLPVADFTNAQFAGIAVFGSASEIPLASATTGVKFETNDRVTAAIDGVVYVLVEDTVTAGAPVFAVHTAGASSVWTFRSDADTAAASDIPAVFQESGVSGDIVPIRLTWSI